MASKNVPHRCSSCSKSGHKKTTCKTRRDQLTMQEYTADRIRRLEARASAALQAYKLERAGLPGSARVALFLTHTKEEIDSPDEKFPEATENKSTPAKM